MQNSSALKRDFPRPITESEKQFMNNVAMTVETKAQAANDGVYSKKPYIIISAVQGSELENKVAVAMQHGYFPQGGVAVSEGIYYQAMTMTN